MNRAYPLADNFQGDNAVFLQSVYLAETQNPVQLMNQLINNASTVYDGVYQRNTDSTEIVTNSVTPLNDGCYTDDPHHSSSDSWNNSDDWWAWDMLCLPELYCEQSVDPSIKIAVIDVGYWDIFNNPDLVGVIDGIEYGFSPNDNIFSTNTSRNYHGLASALAAAAIMDNGVGIAGTGAGAQLLLFHTSIFGVNQEEMIEDFMEAQMRGASIIFATVHLLGCPPNNNILNQFQAALNLMNEYGVTVLYPASNGNDNGCNGGVDLIPLDWSSDWDDSRNLNGYRYPASLPGCISVSGVNSEYCVLATSQNCISRTSGANCENNHWEGQNAGYMTHNDQVNVIGTAWCVPSGIDRACDNGGTVKTYSTGNSIATPMMAGIVAHLLTVNPCLGHDEILDIFLQSEANPNWVNECDANQIVYSVQDHPPLPCAATAVEIAKTYGKYTIDQPTVWDEDRFVTELTIEAGGDLLIENAEITFASNNRVKVKRGGRLIADNAVFNGRSCSNTNKFWAGIQVHGNINLPQPAPNATLNNPDQAGILILRNGTTIKDVDHTAIRNYNEQNWNVENGGLIIANDCKFEGLTRTAAFLKYASGGTSFTDNSSFTDCIFTAPEDQTANSALAISIWKSDGIAFDGNYFEGFEHSAITSWDAVVNVINGNQFIGNTTGVKLLATNIFGSGGVIADNDFNENTYGVDLVSSGVRVELQVSGNEFFKNREGLSVFGPTEMDAFNNSFDFSLLRGTAAAYTDVWETNITDNTYLESPYGIQTFGDCSSAEFLRNCFSIISNPDVTIGPITTAPTGVARVGPSQGNSTTPTNNCFTNDGVDVKADASQVMAFQYFIKPGITTADCQYPDNNLTTGGTYHANYTIEVALESGDSPCAGNILLPNDTLVVGISNERVKEAFAEYLVADSAYLNNPDTVNALLLSEKQDEFTLAARSLFSEAMETQDFPRVESLLTNIDHIDAKEWLVDAAIYFEDSLKAATYLTNYVGKYGLNSFSHTRAVSIELLGHTDKQMLTATQLQKLNTIYQTFDDPQRGIAGSLLDFFQFDAYHFPDLSSAASSTTSQLLAEPSPKETPRVIINDFTLAPNPVRDQLHVFAPPNWNAIGNENNTTNSIADASIWLHDQTGRLVREVKLVGAPSVIIPLNGLSPGIYYVRIQTNAGNTVRKIIKQ